MWGKLFCTKEKEKNFLIIHNNFYRERGFEKMESTIIV